MQNRLAIESAVARSSSRRASLMGRREASEVVRAVAFEAPSEPRGAMHLSAPSPVCAMGALALSSWRGFQRQVDWKRSPTRSDRSSRSRSPGLNFTARMPAAPAPFRAATMLLESLWSGNAARLRSDRRAVPSTTTSRAPTTHRGAIPALTERHATRGRAEEKPRRARSLRRAFAWSSPRRGARWPLRAWLPYRVRTQRKPNSEDGGIAVHHADTATSTR